MWLHMRAIIRLASGIWRDVVRLDVATGAKVKLVDLMRAMNALHILATVDKLRVTAPYALAPASITKDEAVNVFTANLVTRSSRPVDFEKIVNLLVSRCHTASCEAEIGLEIVVAHRERARCGLAFAVGVKEHGLAVRGRDDEG